MALGEIRIKEKPNYWIFYKAGIVAFLFAIFYCAGIEHGKHLERAAEPVPIITLEEYQEKCGG